MELNYKKLEQIENEIARLYAEKYELLKSGSENADLNKYATFIKAQNSVRVPVKNPKIVYQGEPGAYSDMAVQKLFGKKADSKGLVSLEDTFEAIRKDEAD